MQRYQMEAKTGNAVVGNVSIVAANHQEAQERAQRVYPRANVFTFNSQGPAAPGEKDDADKLPSTAARVLSSAGAPVEALDVAADVADMLRTLPPEDQAHVHELVAKRVHEAEQERRELAEAQAVLASLSPADRAELVGRLRKLGNKPSKEDNPPKG